MRSNLWKIIGVGAVLVALLLGTFSIGFLAGNSFTPILERINQPALDLGPDLRLSDRTAVEGNRDEIAAEAGTPADLEELFTPFWQTWNIVHNQYVDQPVDDVALIRGAIRGMLEALEDPFTSYMDPDTYRQSQIPLEGEFEGIGAWVDPDGEFLTIVSPMPGSPAEKAGLKPGDQIIGVDGEDVTGIDGNLVIRRILGPAGTKVRLTVRREGVEEPLEFEIERARITIPSVESRMLENDIGYVQLMQFGDGTDEDLRAALRELLAQEPVGLILDLRNNGGGFLDTAIEVASEFVSEDVILYEEHGSGEREAHLRRDGGLALDIPLVVLVNEGTASASEIVAGALQDYGRAPLIGTKTFGKGSVQIVTPLADDQGAIRVTIARWLTPQERLIHGVGLEPDIEVPLTEEDIENERDPQLEKAIEVLLEQS